MLYCSDMTHGKNKKNFELLPAEEFIARVTQHIPEKGFQMVRYYAWYSNRSMRQRRKEGMLRPGDNPPKKEDSVDHLEECSSRAEAMRHETQIKRYKGGEAFSYLSDSETF